jgi:hypothetical protein
MTGYVYFIRCGEYVKIGYSREPEARRRELEVGNPGTFVIEAMHEGTINDEHKLHRYFQSHHHKLEWFHWCPDIERVARKGLPRLIRGSRAHLRLRNVHKKRRNPFEIRHLPSNVIVLPLRRLPKLNAYDAEEAPLVKAVLGLLTAADRRRSCIFATPEIDQGEYIMNRTNPREQLAVYLKQHGIDACAQFAIRAEVGHRQMANAMQGRPVATVPYLRLAAASGFDPLPELDHPAVVPSDFDAAFFAVAMNMRRQLNHHTDRQAADAMGLSAATVCRIERGDSVNIGVIIKACRYVGIHPFGYLRPANPAEGWAPDTRETFLATG